MNVARSCRRSSTYQVDIRKIRSEKKRELEQETSGQMSQHSDPVATIELRLKAIDLDNASKPNHSKQSMSPSAKPINQLATKDDIALVKEGIHLDRQTYQSNSLRLLELANTTAEIVYDKALDLHVAQQCIDQHHDQLAKHKDQLTGHEERLVGCQTQLAEHEGQLAESRNHVTGFRGRLAEYGDQLANILPRLVQLEAAVGGTETAMNGCNRDLEMMQKTVTRQARSSRQSIQGVRLRTLAEARSTKRKFDQISEQIRSVEQRTRADAYAAVADVQGIRMDQQHMAFCLEQAWVAARERDTDLVALMNSFGQQYQADKQAVEGFHLQFQAHRYASGIAMEALEGGTSVNLAAAVDLLKSQQDALQAELRIVQEESRASRSHHVQQSDGQPATDVAVAHLEPDLVQDRREDGANPAASSPNFYRASATSGSSVLYPPLPEMDGSSHISHGSSCVDGMGRQQPRKRRRGTSPAHPGFRRCETRLQGGRCSGLTERFEGEAEDVRIWYCGNCMMNL